MKFGLFRIIPNGNRKIAVFGSRRAALLSMKAMDLAFKADGSCVRLFIKEVE